jgi:hypothetical protein
MIKHNDWYFNNDSNDIRIAAAHLALSMLIPVIA